MTATTIPVQRSRPIYALAAALVIGTGLLWRSGLFPLPDFIAKYGGDALWALVVFLCFATAFHRSPTVRIALSAVCFAWSVEFLQLYHAPWIDGIRSTRLGHLVLGSTFNSPDLLAYVIGIALGALAERVFLNENQKASAAANGGVPSQLQSSALVGQVAGLESLAASPRDMDEHLENRLRFLREANTGGMPHSDLSLLDHLLGTRQVLVEWGARPALCDAGLFHSIYSTEHYEEKALPLTRRGEVQQLIGEEAESLVWLFCMMRREAFFLDLGKDRNPSVQHRETGEQIYLSGTQHQDLLTLLFANSLEGFPRCSWFERRSVCMALRHYRKFATPSVQRALDRMNVRWWEIWK